VPVECLLFIRVLCFVSRGSNFKKYHLSGFSSKTLRGSSDSLLEGYDSLNMLHREAALEANFFAVRPTTYCMQIERDDGAMVSQDRFVR
jgi:hypothetical protein